MSVKANATTVKPSKCDTKGQSLQTHKNDLQILPEDSDVSISIKTNQELIDPEKL